MALATLSIDLEVRLAKMQEGLDKAGRLAERNAEQMRAAYLRAGAAAAGIGSIIASAFAGFSVVDFVKGNAAAIDALNDVQDATGASIEMISGLEQVAMKTGTTLDSVGSILVKFNKALSEGNPNGPLTLTLKSIGLNADELRRMDPAEALRQTAIALSRFADDGNKARIIQELFGKSVKEAAPFLKDLAEAGQLNAKVTTQQAEEAEKFNKQLFELKTNATNAAREITSALIPALNTFFELRKKKGTFGAIADFLGFDDKFFETKKLAELGAPLRSLNNEKTRIEFGFVQGDRAVLQARLDQIVNVEMPAAVVAYKRAKGELIALSSPPNFFNDRRTSGEVKAPAPALPAKPDASALQEQKTYEALIKRVRERLDISKQELSVGRQLTEVEKFQLDVKAALATAKLSPEHKKEIELLLQEAGAWGKLREEQAETLKSQLAASALMQRLQGAQDQRIDGLISETQSMREASEEIGLSVRQVEELRLKRLEHNVELEREALLMALNADASAADITSREQIIALLERQIKARRDANAKTQAIAESPTKGAEAALDDYALKVANVGVSTRDAVASSMESASSVLTDFFKTGKLNAGKFADEVITQILRITAVQPLVNAGANIIGSFFGLKIPGLSAMGNAFDGAGKVTGFARGDVFDKPTGFTFAGGQLGVLGEAGPEGVLPLRRGADGKLGVIAANAGGGRQVVNNYNTYNVGSGVTRSEVMAAMQTLAQSLNARMDARLAKAGIR